MLVGKRKIIIIGVLILAAFCGFCFKSMAGAVIIHSEKIGAPEIKTMLNCSLFPENFRQVEINGRKYAVPLPDNTAAYTSQQYPGPAKGKQYLTSTTRLEKYLKEKLPRYGWKWKDQLGSLIIIQRKDNEDTLGIDMTCFTHFYLKLVYD